MESRQHIIYTNMVQDTDCIMIVTVCDDHYSIMLAALLSSLNASSAGNANLNIYIVDDGIRPANRRKLDKLIAACRFSLKWLKLRDAVADRSALPLDASTFPLNVYIRLFIPLFVPPHIERVLYLDVDMIVRKDISALWNTDMEGKVLAGVRDRSGTVSSSWGGIRNYRELGLHPETPYFNSGLLLIDTKKWRQGNYTERVLQCVKENTEYAGFPDQYGLNVVFANQWLELDRQWNCYSVYEEPDPFIIHFIGTKPIYSSYSYNDFYKKEFFYYLNYTEWKGFKPMTPWFRFLKKLYNKGTKFLLNLISR